VSTYLDSLHRFPQLPHPEVVKLFQEYIAGRTKIGDDQYDLTPEAKKVRKKLVECNLRLVVSIAKQYKNHNIPIEDLIQEGNIGLMKAVERFDWERGFRFSTYATWWIRQAIGQHVLKRKRIIRLPAHAATVQRKMIQASEEFRESVGHEPTQEEIQEMIGASETVVKATMHSGRAVLSLDQPMQSWQGRGDGGDKSSLGDLIEDEREGMNPFENVAEKQLLEITKRVLKNLSAKESAILRLRFGLVEDATDNESFPITEEEMREVMSGKGMT